MTGQACEQSEAATTGSTSQAGTRTARARRLLAQAGHAGNYPHGVHPALVPGVSVDDQRYDYRTDRIVVLVVAITIVSFVAWGVLDTEGLSAASEAALV